MLKTLDSYIEDSQSKGGLLASLWVRAGRDRRFSLLLTLSVVFHLIFYAALIRLDLWSAQEYRAPARNQAEIVQFVEVAPPDPYKRRPAPESLSRADINSLQFDPNNADDTHLLSRSPRPSTQRGSNAPLPSADEIERQVKAARGAGGGGSVHSPANQPQPPRTAAVTSTGLPQPDSPVIAQAPVAQPALAPPTPAQNQSAAASNNTQEQAQTGARRGDSSESNAFALQSSQGQFIAYVRAKITQENEAILLGDYIRNVLNDRVAAVFELKLGRGGRILDLRLVRSSGHPRLDARAREAIYIASPFKGYPESAGDLLSFTVTLYYFPGR